MTAAELWQRYRHYLCTCQALGLSVDISRMRFSDDFFERLSPAVAAGFDSMAALEAGAIANPDENRRVGHYWLRNPGLAPDARIRDEIVKTVERIKRFAEEVHCGHRRSQAGRSFRNLLLLGIGGSALGPQFVADALGSPGDPIKPFYCDNTDPDGFDRTFAEIGDGLDETLVLVVSKSGGTIETRNAMLEAARRYGKAGLNFAQHALAVTQPGSALDRRSIDESWIDAFPIRDWVGGRTSLMSAVGLLPAALQGFDVEALLAGAGRMDEITRNRDARKNPSALLALMWHHAGGGAGRKDMVVIPYKDRLALLGRYLQQLVMESLGKKTDLDGNTVHQGLTVYGNKGSTDQHAYLQQLRDGLDNFFVTFVGVRRDSQGESPEVEPGVTSGDYLHGFLLGTRQALTESGRESITIMVDEINARTVGALIALFERAVGLYANLINVNPYHQPGVEAGKKAAADLIALRRAIIKRLEDNAGRPATAEEIAAALNCPDEVEHVHHILRHLAANPRRGVKPVPGQRPTATGYTLDGTARDSCT